MCGICAGLLAGKDVMGLTRDQCMVAIGNIDARTQLLEKYPYLQVKTIADHLLPTSAVHPGENIGGNV